MHFSLKGWEDVLFELGIKRVRPVGKVWIWKSRMSNSFAPMNLPEKTLRNNQRSISAWFRIGGALWDKPSSLYIASTTLNWNHQHNYYMNVGFMNWHMTLSSLRSWFSLHVVKQHNHGIVWGHHWVIWWNRVTSSLGHVMESCDVITASCDGIVWHHHWVMWWNRVTSSLGHVMESCDVITGSCDGIVWRHHWVIWCNWLMVSFLLVVGMASHAPIVWPGGRVWRTSQ